MKYIVDLPDAYTSESALFGDILSIPICLEGGKRYGIPTGIKLEPYTEPNEDEIRNKAEDEVWEFAKKIGSFNGLSKHELDECFGHTTIQGVMTTYDTYQEAKDKYDAWKRTKDEIRVGDEVIDKDVGKAIVTNIVFEACSVLWLDGSVSEDVPLGDLHKTGRHFPEVAELLKKMREE